LGKGPVATDVINFTFFAIMKDRQNTLDVIFDMRPIANLLAIVIHRERAIFEGVHDHEQDPVFREVMGP
jgi:hypothetical protein